MLALKEEDGVWTQLACGLLAFHMTLGFFLSCRRFSVALNPVGTLGNGHLGLYTGSDNAIGLSRGLNPGRGSSETGVALTVAHAALGASDGLAPRPLRGPQAGRGLLCQGDGEGCHSSEGGHLLWEGGHLQLGTGST